MCSHAGILYHALGHRNPIDQQPIRLNVTFTKAFPVATQNVIAMTRQKRLSLDKQFVNSLEFTHVLAAPDAQPNIALELVEAANTIERHGLNSQIGVKILSVLKRLALPLAKVIKCGARDGVGKLNGEW